MVSSNSFEMSHTKNTIFLKSTSKISFEGNCIILCDGTGSETVADFYGRIVMLSSSNFLFSSLNHYHRCNSEIFMEYLVSDKTEHYSSNYSSNYANTCSGPLLTGFVELRVLMINSYKCNSSYQVEFFQSKKSVSASRLCFIECTSKAGNYSDLLVYSIYSGSEILDCTFLHSSKTYDCSIFDCSVSFRNLHSSRNSFSCYFEFSGSATYHNSKFAISEVKHSPGVIREGCVVSPHTNFKCGYWEMQQSISILGLALMALHKSVLFL